MKLNRREVLWGATAGAGVVVLGCGVLGRPGPTGGGGAEGCSTGEAEEITANHGHGLTVPTADIQAGVEKTYSIRAGADHAHTVTLSAADFASLAAGSAITVEASVALEHSHSCTIGCGGGDVDPGDDYYP